MFYHALFVSQIGIPIQKQHVIFFLVLQLNWCGLFHSEMSLFYMAYSQRKTNLMHTFVPIILFKILRKGFTISHTVKLCHTHT